MLIIIRTESVISKTHDVMNDEIEQMLDELLAAEETLLVELLGAQLVLVVHRMHQS